MNRSEFQQYLQDTIKEYLPENYMDASITFKEEVKNNDIHLIGMTIVRPEEHIVPIIYIDSFYNDYKKGKNIDEIVKEIANIHTEIVEQENQLSELDQNTEQLLMDYDKVKDKLQIRLCDTQENQDRLANLVHTEHSDFSATYHVEIKKGVASMAVTPMVLKKWGISVEQLHHDALVSDMNRHPVFCDVQNMMESMMLEKEPENLLDVGPGQSGMGIYCLTNKDKMNGAGLILQEDLMQQIREIVGGDFYILPSSCHEVLVVPESMEMDAKELSAIVQQVNETEVSIEDFLSNHIQYYNSKKAIIENADKS